MENILVRALLQTQIKGCLLNPLRKGKLEYIPLPTHNFMTMSVCSTAIKLITWASQIHEHMENVICKIILKYQAKGQGKALTQGSLDNST